jgi:hypothetical protein
VGVGDFLTRNCALFWHLVMPVASSVKAEDSLRLYKAPVARQFLKAATEGQNRPHNMIGYLPPASEAIMREALT